MASPSGGNWTRRVREWISIDRMVACEPRRGVLICRSNEQQVRDWSFRFNRVQQDRYDRATVKNENGTDLSCIRNHHREQEQCSRVSCMLIEYYRSTTMPRFDDKLRGQTLLKLGILAQSALGAANQAPEIGHSNDWRKVGSRIRDQSWSRRWHQQVPKFRDLLCGVFHHLGVMDGELSFQTALSRRWNMWRIGEYTQSTYEHANITKAVKPD